MTKEEKSHIQLSKVNKDWLDSLKLVDDETYNSVLNRIKKQLSEE